MDNTLNRCRLLRLDPTNGRVNRTICVALSGKNLTFLPGCGGGSDGSGAESDEPLFLVHWFVPLEIYRVVLPPEKEMEIAAGAPAAFATGSSVPEELFASLDCVYRA